MGVPILILGESGTGKTTSLRNFKNDELALINVAGKPLPFRGKFDGISGTTDFRKIYTFLKTTKAKTIVIDDAQYIMSFQYMRRIKENGWDKFNELQSDFFNLIDCVKDLPSDTVVYFLSHIETKDDGRQKIKTIGKMLDEKITVEGMFTVVLKTYVTDGKYYFLTQNSGSDTVKSPMDMFPSYAIDNDLKYVDEKIRNYYELGAFLTDEEMAEIDKEAAQLDIFKDEVEGKKRRSARGRKQEENTDNNNKPAESSSVGTNEEVAPSGESSDEVSTGHGRRNRRSVDEDMAEERKAVEEENARIIANHGINENDEREEVPYEETTDPTLVDTPRRKRRNKNEQEPTSDEQKETTDEKEEEKSVEENSGEDNSSAEENVEEPMNPPVEETEEVSETTTRRRRRRG